MSQFLLLNSGEKSYPAKFIDVEYIPEGAQQLEDIEYRNKKILDIENRLAERIHKFNHNLVIDEIKYVKLNDLFPKLHNGTYTGLIVEEKDISREELDYYTRKKDVAIISENNKILIYEVLYYVFLSAPTEEWRNTLFTQSIFPELIDYMAESLEYPTYTFANHPMLFINIINKELTASSLIKRIKGIIAMGLHYIELFPKTIESSNVSVDFASYLHDCVDGYNPERVNYDTPNYFIDTNNKVLKIKTEKLAVGNYLILKDDQTLDFHGSDEKFYWMDVLPIIVRAKNAGYSIDISELCRFCQNEDLMFSEKNKKFQRFIVLKKYIEKLYHL